MKEDRPQGEGRGGPLPREAGGEAPAGSVPCELCGAPVLERHCKIVCRNCGYMRDCSDP